MNGEINWGAPIEAVHEDGRVVAAVARQQETPDSYRLVHIAGEMLHDMEQEYAFKENGHRVYARDWTIRNVATPPADARTAPNGGEVGPEVVERMKALVRKMASEPKHLEGAWTREARAIVALMSDDNATSVIRANFLVPKLTEAQAREWVATNAPGAKADGLLAFLAEHSALLPEPVDAMLEKVTVSIRNRGDHDVSLGELSRLINGGARITGIRALEKEAGR